MDLVRFGLILTYTGIFVVLIVGSVKSAFVRTDSFTGSGFIEIVFRYL
jgi:hypothetical protein